MITSSLSNARTDRDERRPFLYTRRSAQGGGNFADDGVLARQIFASVAAEDGGGAPFPGPGIAPL